MCSCIHVPSCYHHNNTSQTGASQIMNIRSVHSLCCNSQATWVFAQDRWYHDTGRVSLQVHSLGSRPWTGTRCYAPIRYATQTGCYQIMIARSLSHKKLSYNITAVGRPCARTPHKAVVEVALSTKKDEANHAILSYIEYRLQTSTCCISPRM